MAKNNSTPDEKAVIDEIDALDRQVTDYAAFIRKVKNRLSRCKKGISGNTATASHLSSLTTDLRALKSIPDAPDVSKSIERMESLLPRLRKQLQDSFAGELRRACEAAKLPLNSLSSGFGVGPFLLVFDLKKDAARLEYAKVVVAKDVPLHPESIVKAALSLKSAIIDEPVDEARFGKQLGEAMRVAAARNTRQYKSELRVDIPKVFHEMTFVQCVSASRGRPSVLDYPLPRFVVELKRFVQSDLNMKAKCPFRLETAVLENTKNPKKSIFLPRDHLIGYGEGTYYQAIVLQCE